MLQNSTENKALSLADKALTDLTAQLDAGHSETLTRYLAFLARFHRYSATNVLLIQLQRPDATHVAGFNRWRDLRRNVRKGEKGVAILAPVTCRRRDDRDVDQKEEQDRGVVAGFRTAYVFDVAQTDGADLPSIGSVMGEPGERLQALKNLVTERGIELGYIDDLAGARGVSHGGWIELLTGMHPAEEFAVLTHELAHEALHKGERRAKTDLRIRELEAEAVSFVVSTGVGLENSSASRDYIHLYAGDSKALAESLSHIQRVATEILNRIL